MNVLQVGTGFTSIPPNESAATEEVIYYLSRELKKLDCTVGTIDILDHNRLPSNLQLYEVPYFSFLKTTKSNSIGLIFKRLYFFFFSSMVINKLDGNFDIIHFHNQFPASVFHISSKLHSKGIPIVFTLHNPVWGLPAEEMPSDLQVKFALEVMAMKSANKVIAVSEILKTNIINRLGLSPSSVVTLPNGVDSEIFSPNNTCITLKKKLAPHGEKIILCVGRICKYKSQKLLVDVAPYIIREYPEVKFVFVGPIDDFSYFEEITSAINSHSLKKFFTFTGTIPSNQIPRYFATADIVVSLSITEGLPLVLLQAMSSGRPVVASSIPQNIELAKNGDEMVFVRPLNHADLSNALLKFLNDENTRNKFGKNARRTILAYFDWKIIANKTYELYEKIIED
jgi:glycosyltransferase involved in cell wall biosynthesis